MLIRNLWKIFGVVAAAPVVIAYGEIRHEVAPFDWDNVSPEQISDAYVYRPLHSNGKNFSFAYYLGHFHRLANAVRMEEPDRGFIELSVWRNPRDNKPYNARILENITSLAWMYARNEPWNPYYGDAVTRARLEAAMRFWAKSQNEEGRFSEYGEGRWNLAATAFATKFIGEALVQLKEGPPVDAEILEQVREANRKAILLTLNDESFWRQGVRFSNQYGNVFAGALAHLQLYDDDEMARDLQRQMVKALDAFQSPAGYMYEWHGPDWGYYFGTHHSNVHMIWHYGRDKTVGGVNLGDLVAKEYERSTEWLAYNAVPQPDGERFFLNRAIEFRQSRASFNRLETPLSEVVPLARAFSVTQEERAERLEWSRNEFERDWGGPPALRNRAFSSYSPYAFLHRDHDRFYPTESERMAAYQNLPYIARDRFVHQRKDADKDDTYTFVRRPAYYAAFNSGSRIRARTRGGLGLLWHPGLGTLLQSQTNSTEFAWGTRTLGDNLLWESGDVDAIFKIDGAEQTATAGARDLPDGELQVSYRAKTGRKEVHFADDSIVVEVAMNESKESDAFIEQLPLLLAADDEVRTEEQQVRVLRDGQPILEVLFEGADEISLAEGDRVDGLSLIAVHAQARGTLAYTLRPLGSQSVASRDE